MKPKYNIKRDCYSNGYAVTIKCGKKVIADKVFEGINQETMLKFKEWSNQEIGKHKKKELIL